MPYVTRGTIQLVETGNSNDDHILITPADDYSVKRGNDRYCVFIDPTPAAIDAKIYSSDHKFCFNNALKESLRTAAFKRTLLELILDLDNSGTITEIKIPATP